MRFHLSIVGLHSWANGILFGECYPMHLFSSSSFGISGFKFRSLDHLNLLFFFVQDDKYGLSLFILHIDFYFFQHHLLKLCLFFRVLFWFLCQIPNGFCFMYSYMGLLFYSIGLHVYFVPIFCCFYFYIFVIYLNIWNDRPSRVILFA